MRHAPSNGGRVAAKGAAMAAPRAPIFLPKGSFPGHTRRRMPGQPGTRQVPAAIEVFFSRTGNCPPVPGSQKARHSRTARIPGSKAR